MAGGHLAGHKSTAADLGAWLCWEDESGQGLRPPKGRTWGRRGCTPVVTVTGGHDTRVSLAALLAVRPGQRPRLIYRTHRARRGDKRKGFTEHEYARLLDAAHRQLGGPVVLVWDNLNTHTSGAMAGADRGPGLADRLPASAICQRAEPGGASLVEPQKIAGQPHQAQHQPADRADQDPAPADAVPSRPPRGLPRQDPP